MISWQRSAQIINLGMLLLNRVLAAANARILVSSVVANGIQILLHGFAARAV